MELPSKMDKVYYNDVGGNAPTKKQINTQKQIPSSSQAFHNAIPSFSFHSQSPMIKITDNQHILFQNTLTSDCELPASGQISLKSLSKKSLEYQTIPPCRIIRHVVEVRNHLRARVILKHDFPLVLLAQGLVFAPRVNRTSAHTLHRCAAAATYNREYLSRTL